MTEDGGTIAGFRASTGAWRLTPTNSPRILPAVRMPSIRAAATDAKRVALRFPMALLSGAVAASAASIMAGQGKASESLEAALAAATLGLAFFTALSVAAARSNARLLAPVLALGGALGLVAFALAWPHWTDAVQIRRYAQISIGLHLLVAFLPYLRGGEPNGFWQYNRTLFLRFLTAALYASVLYLGLTVALVALNQLFKVPVPSTVYTRLWLWIAFVFNTWFFLGGVPSDLPALEQRRDYPRGLKVFTQFILIPLVAIYLAILTAYLVKVVVTGQWPSGWIGWLVSSVAAVGILSLLLVHPIRESEENRWVATYARWFYLAILPAVGMLLVAIWKRIDQYGVTEDRYFIAILALWLAGIAVTFIVRRSTDIRWIPITLCILAFATLCGPFGAYTVSRRSQTERLRELLDKAGLIEGGVVHAAVTPLPFETRKELSSSVLYLVGAHGASAVRDLTGGALPARSDSATSVYKRAYDSAAIDAKAIMSAWGMDYVNSWEGVQSKEFSFNRWRTSVQAVEVGDLDYHLRLYGQLPVYFEIEGRRWGLRSVGRSLELAAAGGAPMMFPMDTLVAFVRKHGDWSADTTRPPVLVAESAEGRGTLVPDHFDGRADADSIQMRSFNGDLYLDLARP